MTKAVCGTILAIVVFAVVAPRLGRRPRWPPGYYRIHGDLGSPGSVTVIDSTRLDAFATPAPSGRVVITSALLRALTSTERRVVLAHEQSTSRTGMSSGR